MKITNAKKNRRIKYAESTRPKPICPACGKSGSHFVPPSMGEEGFFFCLPESGTND